MNEIFAPTLPEAWYAGAEDPDSRDHCQLLGSDQAFRGSLPLAAFCPCTETGIVEQALRPRLKCKTHSDVPPLESGEKLVLPGDKTTELFHVILPFWSCDELIHPLAVQSLSRNWCCITTTASLGSESQAPATLQTGASRGIPPGEDRREAELIRRCSPATWNVIARPESVAQLISSASGLFAAMLRQSRMR
jgi:hypothetical protein